MESFKESNQPTFVQRGTALGLALATTTFIATSVIAVFTGNAQMLGATLIQAAAPLRVILGG